MRAHGLKRKDFWSSKKELRDVAIPTQDIYAIIRKWIKNATPGVYEFYNVLWSLPTPRPQGRGAPTYFPYSKAVRAFEKYGAVILNDKLYVI